MSGDLAAMARRIADDPHAPVRDRSYALDVLHRLQHGLPITATDRLRLRCVHGVRRRMVIASAEHWCGATG